MQILIEIVGEMAESEENWDESNRDTSPLSEVGEERETQLETSPQSPQRKTAPQSQDDKKERKRSREEMNSRGFMVEDASSSYPETYRPSPRTRAHPLLAPRSTPFMPPDPFSATSFPLSGADGSQISIGGISGFDDEPSAEDFARMSRSERKRYREKKRRSEVNRGFDELTAVLLRVKYVHEPRVVPYRGFCFVETHLFLSAKCSPSLKAELEQGEKSRRHQRSGSGDGEQNLVINRVDLISRTIATLERMDREKEECKARMIEMAQSGNDIAAAQQAMKDDRVGD